MEDPGATRNDIAVLPKECFEKKRNEASHCSGSDTFCFWTG
jgi:hypothetical protein